jgi:hypothetical protein
LKATQHYILQKKKLYTQRAAIDEEGKYMETISEDY